MMNFYSVSCITSVLYHAWFSSFLADGLFVRVLARLEQYLNLPVINFHFIVLEYSIEITIQKMDFLVMPHR